MVSVYNDKIKKYGFVNSIEYRNYLAQLKGFKDYNDYRQCWRNKKIGICKGKLLSERL